MKIYARALIAVGEHDGFVLACKGRCWDYLHDGAGSWDADAIGVNEATEPGLWLFEGQLQSQRIHTPFANEYEEWMAGTYRRLTPAELEAFARGEDVVPETESEPGWTDGAPDMEELLEEPDEAVARLERRLDDAIDRVGNLRVELAEARKARDAKNPKPKVEISHGELRLIGK